MMDDDSGVDGVDDEDDVADHDADDVDDRCNIMRTAVSVNMHLEAAQGSRSVLFFFPFRFNLICEGRATCAHVQWPLVVECCALRAQ